MATEMPREHIEGLRSCSPNVSIVLLSDELGLVPTGPLALMTRGVVGTEDSVDALLRLLGGTAGSDVSDASDAEPIASRRRRRSQLSPRENEISALVGQGLSNREIAGRLGLGEQSVKNMLSRILKKLGMTNRVQVALRARAAR
jgi:DNA-binding NarL/FixJ family response regulator